MIAPPLGPWLPFGFHTLSFWSTKLCGELGWCIGEVQERRTDFPSLECILRPVLAYTNPYVMGDGRSFAITGSDTTQKSFLHFQGSLERLVEVCDAVIDLNLYLTGKGFRGPQYPFRQVRSPYSENLLTKDGWEITYPEPHSCLP